MYYVLKSGMMEGPFEEDELQKHLESGHFSPDDFAQLEKGPYWTRLSHIFDLEFDPTVVGAEPAAHGRFQDLRSTARSLWERLLAKPLEMGLFCLAMGCALVLFSYFPLLIYGPWLIGAMIGGGVLMLRGRVGAGLGLSGAAIFLPIAIWFAMSGMRGGPQ